MDDSTAKTWVVYCWRGIEDDDANYFMKIWQIAHDSEDRGSNVRLEKMKYNAEKRLWDHIIDKISELTTSAELNEEDSFLIVVSHSILDSETFLKEEAYALGCSREYPKGALPLIGLMYV